MFNPMRKTAIILLLFFSSSCCLGAKLPLDKLASYPPEIQQAIKERRIKYGMTREQLAIMFGETECKATIYDKNNAVIEYWDYQFPALFPLYKRPQPISDCSKGETRAYFKNDRLFSWENYSPPITLSDYLEGLFYLAVIIGLSYLLVQLEGDENVEEVAK